VALVVIGAGLIMAGLFRTPIAATSYVLIHNATTPAHRTEAYTWLSTGQAVGTAAGAVFRLPDGSSKGSSGGIQLEGTAGLPGAGAGVLCRNVRR
jgi:hypothetical protein